MLSKVFNLSTVAAGIAAGLLIAGVLALVGGQYAGNVVHDQLTPQNIAFPPKGSELPANLNQYAGAKVDTAAEAKAYADDYIGLHLKEIGGGKSYSQVSAAWMAHPEDEKLAQTRQTMFMGEMLRATLLSAWGWGTVATIATIAGISLIVIGGLLLVVPVLTLVTRRRRELTPADVPAASPIAA